MNLNETVPWGRSFDEYVKMFDLTPQDVTGKIIDCAGGPASSNAKATQKGHRVISCDPLYRFTAEEIADRIGDTYL